MVLDVSGSMGISFGPGENRFEGAVAAAKQFCGFRKGDAFGLTIFGSEYIHWVPPTRELSAVVNAMKYVRPDNMPPWMGGTLIANALRGCREQLLRAEEGDRAVILISDGGSGDFGNGGDRAVADLAAYLRGEGAKGDASFPADPDAAGRLAWDLHCGLCHTVDGYRELRSSLEGMDRDELEELVDSVADLMEEMPPYLGDDVARVSARVCDPKYVRVRSSTRSRPRTGAARPGRAG